MIRSFNGKSPNIATSAYVNEAAYVIGDVTIGEGSGIWPGAVVRADFGPIRIGCNTMIEDNCVLHSGTPLDIGDNIIVGHGVVIHCRRVGSNNLIGNNATILDEAEIGNFCVIGAGSLVRTGMRIPDNSFVVGAPAQIKGQISSAQRRRLAGGSGSYGALLKQHKEQGL